MSAKAQDRVREAFELALRVPRPGRDEYLQNLRKQDTSLADEVAQLLLSQTLTVESSGETVPTAGESLAPGLLIANRYRIVRMIGRGGMGEVYECLDNLLNEAVALKRLRPDLAGSAASLSRFRQEIQLSRKVTHPNVCRVYEVGVHTWDRGHEAPLRFFTMELLAGETLSARIRRRGRLSRGETFPLAAQMARGLLAAHQAGIVHADFKSGNVILVPAPEGDRAVITDFGLSRATADSDPLAPDNPQPLAGTVAFMSPEQLTGGPVTAASDIFAFGVVLYEMATGKLPFDPRHLIQSAMQRGSDVISPRLLVPGIDPRWESAIRRCLRRDPQKRFSSAGELVELFEGWHWQHLNLTRRDWALTAGIAGGAFAGGIGLWIWGRKTYQPSPEAMVWYRHGVAAMDSMTYESARRALENAVSADPGFALAHARLARAHDELDFSDLAKATMLRALGIARTSRLSRLDEIRLRALQLWLLRDFEQAAPLIRQLEEEAAAGDKAAAALETGWLEQQRENTNDAEAAYRRALQLNPLYAAAKLRLGFILGRQRKLTPALEAFQQAEAMYDSVSDFEGAAETLIEKASLLNRSTRAAEAMPVIEKGLAIARATGGLTQQLRLQLLQGVAYRNAGNLSLAAQMVHQTVEVARNEKMENIAISGLNDLGNLHLLQEQPNEAEGYFRQALELAQRSRAQRGEARARLSLASLCEQAGKFADAKRYIDLALPFYTKAGYRREFVQAMLLMGSVHRRLAELEESARILREALRAAILLDDRRTLAQVRERLSGTLGDQGALPQALEECEEALRLLGPGLQSGHAILHCAALAARLGRMKEAEQSLAKVGQMLGAGARQRSLEFWHNLRQSEIAYLWGRWEKAASAAQRAITSSARDPGAVGFKAELALALAKIRMGLVSQGSAAAENTVQNFSHAGLAHEAASGRLLLAEACLVSGEKPLAKQNALEALRFFQPRRIYESEWRCQFIVYQAAQDQADSSLLDESLAALSNLRRSWPAGWIEGYLARHDIVRLRGSMAL